MAGDREKAESWRSSSDSGFSRAETKGFVGHEEKKELGVGNLSSPFEFPQPSMSSTRFLPVPSFFFLPSYNACVSCIYHQFSTCLVAPTPSLLHRLHSADCSIFHRSEVFSLSHSSCKCITILPSLLFFLTNQLAVHFRLTFVFFLD